MFALERLGSPTDPALNEPVSVEYVGLVAAAAAIIPKVLTTDVNHDIYQLSGILNEDDITFKAKQLLSDSIYDLIATKIQNSSDSKISQTNKEEKEQSKYK